METEPDASQLLLRQFHELRSYCAYYITAKADGVRLFVGIAAGWMVLAALGFVVVAGLIVTANYFMLSGTAEGLGVLCGGRAWAGKIIAGFLLSVLLGLGVCYTAIRRKSASRERTVRKYEKRKAEQRTEFGFNVVDRAAAASEGGRGPLSCSAGAGLQERNEPDCA